MNQNFRVNNINSQALSQICFQLDGIPLAIELAVARIKVLSLEQISERLKDRFNLLTGGKRTDLPRQRTLRALIDWSYDLLSVEEKILWKRLSVFSGGFDLEAAVEICYDEFLKEEDIIEMLSNLAEKSIIIFDDLNERYKMLETIRQYGKDLFENPEEVNSIMRKHLGYFLKFAESMNLKFRGSEQAECFIRLESENGNFQTALSWSLEGMYKEEGARLAISLGWYWFVRGYIYTATNWLEIILENSNEICKSNYAGALYLRAEFKLNEGDYEGAKSLFEKCLSYKQELGDKRGIAISFTTLGNIANVKGEFQEAKTLYEKSIALSRELEDKHNTCTVLNNLGQIEIYFGNYETAKKIIEESYTLSVETGDKYLLYFSLHNAGHLAISQNDFERASEYFQKSLSVSRETGFKAGISESLYEQGEIATYHGDFERARECFDECLNTANEIGEKVCIVMAHNGKGNLEYMLGNYNTAKLQYEKCIKLSIELGDKKGLAKSLRNIGNLEFELSEFQKARSLFEESLKLQFEMGLNPGISDCLIALAEISNKENNFDSDSINVKRAVRMLGAAERIILSLGIKLSGSELLRYERTFKSLNEKIADETFSEYFDEGKEITIEQAVELALSNDKC